jgi:hypothetical protein
MFRASCFLILAWTALAGDLAFSDETAPRAPMAAPTAQSRKIPNNPFRCDRLIQYKGKTLPCDSALRRDGESLRAIMEHNPDALEELDQYQAGRNSVKYSGYVGTAGVIIALTGSWVANLFIDNSRQTARHDVAQVLRVAGFTITVGSVVFGLSALRSNESHLQNSIMKYNASEPDQPIEVMFKTQF